MASSVPARSSSVSCLSPGISYAVVASVCFCVESLCAIFSSTIVISSHKLLHPRSPNQPFSSTTLIVSVTHLHQCHFLAGFLYFRLLVIFVITLLLHSLFKPVLLVGDVGPIEQLGRYVYRSGHVVTPLQLVYRGTRTVGELRPKPKV